MAASTDLDGILGLDTATPETAVALVLGERLLSESAVGPGADGRPRHAPALLEQVLAAVNGAGGWERVGLIAVGVGPGAFTGLRVGIATARALAQARGLALAPVCSLAALARGIDREGRSPQRPRLAALDARRGEVFAAVYGADGEAIRDPFVSTPERLGDHLAGLVAPPLAAGDGPLRFRHQFEAAGVEVLRDADPAHRMAARDVCALAGAAVARAPELVNPIYLRRPDAEVWRERGNR